MSSMFTLYNQHANYWIRELSQWLPGLCHCQLLGWIHKALVLHWLFLVTDELLYNKLFYVCVRVCVWCTHVSQALGPGWARVLISITLVFNIHSLINIMIQIHGVPYIYIIYMIMILSYILYSALFWLHSGFTNTKYINFWD